MAESNNQSTTAGSKEGKSEPIFFCDSDLESHGGFLSPWWYYFFREGSEQYEYAGQYILAEKARAFGDRETFDKILNADTPAEMISLAQNIKGAEEGKWRRVAPRIAENANLFKFTQDNAGSRDLLRKLHKLGDRELVFADVSDAILGIGFSAAEAQGVDRKHWGANIFGKSLNVVRDLIKDREIIPGPFPDGHFVIVNQIEHFDGYDAEDPGTTGTTGIWLKWWLREPQDRFTKTEGFQWPMKRVNKIPRSNSPPPPPFTGRTFSFSKGSL